MKRLAAVALIVVGTALPVCAQRSASHGGFSGHSASAFHGGFSASAPSRFAGSSHFSPGRSPSIARGSRRGFAGNFRAHPPYNGARRHRRPYISPYGTGAFYGVPGYGVPGLVNPYLLGYPDTIGDDDSQASPTNPAEGYDQQTQDQGPPEFRPSYPPQPPTDLPHSSPPAASQEAVTLIFKDGRPPQQIYNYLLTRTTLYVGDVPRRDIPIAQLDLAATAKVNHDAGIDFRLPVAPM